MFNKGIFMKNKKKNNFLSKELRVLGDEIGDFLHQLEQEKRLNTEVTNYHAEKLDRILRNIYFVCMLKASN